MSLHGHVGIFGGTFNPIHLGHLNLAIELFEKCNLSKVLFVPTSQSPLRQDETLLVKEHRLAMTQLAVAGLARFEVSESEIHRDSPSYTIDTLRTLRHTYPKLVLLLGEDCLETFPLWKEAEAIVKEFPIRIGARRSSFTGKYPPFMKEMILEGLVNTSLFDISATAIRDRLKKDLYCGHLVPSKVLDYIHENQLY